MKTKMNRFKLELVSWADCFKPGCWKRTHIGAGLMFFNSSSELTLDLLFAYTIWNHGPESFNAADHVRSPQYHPNYRRDLQSLDLGSFWSTNNPSLGKHGHVFIPLDHRHTCCQIFERLASSSPRRLDQCCIPVLLHDIIWRKLGARPVGDAR